MIMAGDGRRGEGRGLKGSTEQVVGFVRNLIDRGRLRPGDRLPSERDLTIQIGVSRPSVRAGLHALAAMGVVRSRHGSGTYIPDGPPSLGSEPLSFLAALHGFTRDEMYETRRILETEAAGLAAARATSEHLATLAEEVAGLFANRDNPHLFLVHDINFHRSVAESAKNPIVGALSAWSPRSTTNGAGTPRSARPTAIFATRPRPTGGFTRPSGGAIPRARGAR
jgi:GntR family transcriptional repressor for pyruvate dehydrogenase complex